MIGASGSVSPWCYAHILIVNWRIGYLWRTIRSWPEWSNQGAGELGFYPFASLLELAGHCRIEQQKEQCRCQLLGHLSGADAWNSG